MNWEHTAQIAERLAGALCLLSIAGSAAYFAWDTHQTQLAARKGIASGSAVADHVATTLEIVNRPCGTKDNAGKLQPCGTLAEIDKATVKLQDVTVTAQRQIAQTDRLVVAAAGTLSQAGASIQSAAGSVQQTATAATESLQALKVDLTAVQEPIAGTTALLARGTGTLNDADNLLNKVGPDLQGTLAGVNGIAANLDRTTGSVARMSDHLEKTVDAPKPLWEKLVPGAQLGAKLYLCLFQHVCVD